jgi:hypothetical protein
VAAAIWLASSSDMFFSVRTACALAALAIREMARADAKAKDFMEFSRVLNGSINRGRTVKI